MLWKTQMQAAGSCNGLSCCGWTLLAAAKIHFELSVKWRGFDDSLLGNILG